MSDREIQQIVRELKQDGFYVDPQLEARFDAGQLRQIEANVADSSTRLQVIALPLDYGDEYDGSGGQVASLVHDHGGPDGAYLVWDGQTDMVSLDTESWGTPDPYDAVAVADDRAPDDGPQQLVMATQLISDGTAGAEYAKLTEEESAAPDSSDDADPTTVVAVVAGVVVAVVIAAVLVRWNQRNVEKGGGHHFTLPKNVLTSVGASRERRWRLDADAAILALGERIDAAELDSDADTTTWRSALDYYDAAGRVRSTATNPADLVGSLLLARRGDAALTAALKDQRYTPSATCYFNPFHGSGSQRARWKGPSGSVQVPACTRCARALERGRRSDTLSLTIDGRTVPYYDTGAEPWVSTGFGALEPDLLTYLASER